MTGTDTTARCIARLPLFDMMTGDPIPADIRLTPDTSWTVKRLAEKTASGADRIQLAGTASARLRADDGTVTGNVVVSNPECTYGGHGHLLPPDSTVARPATRRSKIGSFSGVIRRCDPRKSRCASGALEYHRPRMTRPLLAAVGLILVAHSYAWAQGDPAQDIARSPTPPLVRVPEEVRGLVGGVLDVRRFRLVLRQRVSQSVRVAGGVRAARSTTSAPATSCRCKARLYVEEELTSPDDRERPAFLSLRSVGLAGGRQSAHVRAVEAAHRRAGARRRFRSPRRAATST